MSRRIKDWFTTQLKEGVGEKGSPGSVILPLLSPSSSLTQFNLHLCPRMVASAPHSRFSMETGASGFIP